jgi:hypothetical protein
MNISHTLSTLAFILVATILEVNGDAVVRIAIYNHVGVAQVNPPTRHSASPKTGMINANFMALTFCWFYFTDIAGQA